MARSRATPRRGPARDRGLPRPCHGSWLSAGMRAGCPQVQRDGQVADLGVQVGSGPDSRSGSSLRSARATDSRSAVMASSMAGRLPVSWYSRIRTPARADSASDRAGWCRARRASMACPASARACVSSPAAPVRSCSETSALAQLARARVASRAAAPRHPRRPRLRPRRTGAVPHRRRRRRRRRSRRWPAAPRGQCAAHLLPGVRMLPGGSGHGLTQGGAGEPDAPLQGGEVPGLLVGIDGAASRIRGRGARLGSGVPPGSCRRCVRARTMTQGA